jgi:hypothetical protein
MSSRLFVVAPSTNHTQFAGIAHPHAVRGIQGPAVFSFRQLPPAVHLAQAVDHRMLYNPFDTFTEELIEPYANLFIGQSLDIHYEFNHDEPLRNVVIGRVTENDMKNYAQATQISIIVVDQQDDELIISDIISPLRDLLYTAKYLDYLFDKENQ